MATSKVIYKGNLRTEATHLQSKTKLITDAPIDNNGKGETFSPTDLVATALSSCMLTIIGIKANQSNLTLGNIETEVTKIMSSNPRMISEIIINFVFKGKSYTDKEKIIIINAAKTCPVALSINPKIKQTLNFNFES